VSRCAESGKSPELQPRATSDIGVQGDAGARDDSGAFVLQPVNDGTSRFIVRTRARAELNTSSLLTGRLLRALFSGQSFQNVSAAT
jgi:hypothetical protein